MSAASGSAAPVIDAVDSDALAATVPTGSTGRIDRVKALDIVGDVVRWQRLHGRHDLPWQRNRDPYRVWLSEVMLQQTQVATVIPYFEAFVAAFPTLADLAAAPLDRVMALWSGLGYYSRARNLHAAATRVVELGSFPGSAAQLAELPGVGRSTAAAIAVFGFGERAAILDGNVKRLFCRLFALDGHLGEAGVLRDLWERAQAELPQADAPSADIRAYTQGLMDLGATVCTRSDPACGHCPLQDKCLARRNGTVTRHPAPRPRRASPVRDVDMVLLCHRDAVLIQRRPAVGIWGGLWSLPEADVDSAAPSIPAAGLRLDRSRYREFVRFEHTFTHFRMKARVWRANVDEAEADHAMRGATTSRWLALADAGAAPLPSPVKSLLLGLATGDLLDAAA